MVCSLSLKDILSANFAVPFAPPSSLPFPSPFEVRCGELVGEVERNRHLPSSLSVVPHDNACVALAVSRFSWPMRPLAFIQVIVGGPISAVTFLTSEHELRNSDLFRQHRPNIIRAPVLPGVLFECCSRHQDLPIAVCVLPSLC